MKIFPLIFLIFATFACAEKKSTEKKASNQEINETGQLPHIVFDTEMHNFGRIKSGEILAFSYIFTNRGKADLIIDKADADCSCIQETSPKKTFLLVKKGLLK